MQESKFFRKTRERGMQKIGTLISHSCTEKFTFSKKYNMLHIALQDLQLVEGVGVVVDDCPSMM